LSIWGHFLGQVIFVTVAGFQFPSAKLSVHAPTMADRQLLVVYDLQ
jgi:hypothetical protein